jgi:Tfp pilus assembly protein PilX
MEKGFSLITVLAVLVVLALGTATVLQAVGSHTNMKSNNIQEVKARFLAEAGMQHALWKCRTSSCTTETITIDGTSVAITKTALTNSYKIQVVVDYTDV